MTDMDDDLTPLVDRIAAAARDIGGFLEPTALIESQPLSEAIGARVLLKAEHRQPTGSFKVRGASNALLSATPESLAKGVVTASSGNHGAAVAWAAGKLGAAVTVHTAIHASPAKLANIRRLGGIVVTADADQSAIEGQARALGQADGRLFVSPYNDLAVVAGQGTIGVDLLEQEPDLDAVFVTVGGGGLAAGVAAWIKRHRPSVRIYGCLPKNSAFMAALARGDPQDEVVDLPTLSDGSAGRIEDDAVTIDICRAWIDDYVLLSEVEIAVALRDFIDGHHELIEGSAAVAIAGAVKRRDALQGKTVAIILCGANISSATLRDALVLAG